jgi:uncharacterized protein (TIGR02147 family)
MLSAGLSSPSHLKMIIDGKRNLTNKSLPKYLKAIKFNSKNDESYFSSLVNYNQCQETEEKVILLEQLLNLKKKKGLNELQVKQFNFLSKWHYVTIYVLIDMKDFQASPGWISQRLRKKVSHKQIEKALVELIELSLIEIDEDRGYKQTSGALSTKDEVQNLAIHAYHKNMIDLASQSLTGDDIDSREFNGATLPIPQEKLHIIKEKIRNFRKEINELASSYEDPNQVYQLNIQFFPLTEDHL